MYFVLIVITSLLLGLTGCGSKPAVVVEYELTILKEGAGEVSISPDQAKYNANSTVTLTASPDNGYRFDHWSGSLTGTEAQAEVIVDEDLVITAWFVQVAHAPVAIADSATVDEDEAVLVNVLANDTDADGDTLSISSYTQGSNGTVGQEGNILLYTPAANFTGSDSFTYEISDGNGGAATGTVSITINSVNDSPVANNDSATTSQNVAVDISVLANDSDIEGSVALLSFTQPINGVIADNGDGTVKYTPNTNFNGSDAFSYTIGDLEGATATATVNITVTFVNQAPTANDDSITVDEDTPTILTVLDNDSDPEGDLLTITSVTAPSNGSLSNLGSAVEYTPNTDFYGSDSFQYTISDPAGKTSSATINITVNSINDLPVATDDPNVIDEDGTVLIDVLVNDTDVDGDTLSITGTTPATNGAVSQEGDSLRYTPNANFNGADSFMYEIGDGNGGIATATVNITVKSINDLPVAVNESVPVDEDSTVLIDVLVNDTDVDGDTLSITGFTQGTKGAVGQEGDSLRYDPNDDFYGADSFMYEIGDGRGGIATATVSITVNPINDLPVAANDSGSVDENSSVLIDVLVNDTDVDGDTLSITGFTHGANGVVSQEGDSLRYTPNANFNGADSFTYDIGDGRGGVATATVNITVNPS